MHKRIVFLFGALLAVSTLAVAQTQVTKILSASDITAMINHGDAIADELDAVEVPVDWTAAAFMNMEEGDDLVTYMNNLRKTPVSAEVRAIFRKYGLGDNGFEKYIVMTIAISTEVTRAELEEVKALYAMMPEGESFTIDLDKMLVRMEETVHPADLQLVRSRLGELEFMTEE